MTCGDSNCPCLSNSRDTPVLSHEAGATMTVTRAIHPGRCPYPAGLEEP
jgi:hypothetical protein